MAYLDRHPKLYRFLQDLNLFFQNPYTSLKGFFRKTGLWFWQGLVAASKYSYAGVRRQSTGILVGLAVLAGCVALLIGAYCGLAIWLESRMAPVSDAPQKVVYLDQGWGGTNPNSSERLNYYYLPQGAFLKNIRYDWLVHLERPWKEERFAEPKYMRAYGFIVDPAQSAQNPGNLPVGFTPRYDPKYNEMMLDLNCAVCHTGELQVVKNNQRISVRVDGGSGHQDFTGQKAGQFATDLLVSLLFTRINPLKWGRFSAAVLGEQDHSDSRSQLRSELTDVIFQILGQALREARLGIHPVPDGYGRTDGLGGIMNAAFAVSLDHDNYRVANAPVSYPFVWDIPWLNWVQYTASVRQPMARNIGEAMGTGARYYLTDPYQRPLPASERFDASLKLANLQEIESLLRTLRAPCWPEDLFGKIDRERAARGKDLFEGKYHCAGCHGPHRLPAVYTASEAPLKLEERNPLVNPYRSRMVGGPPPETWQIPPGTVPPYRLEHWVLAALPAEQIGTDVTSALNFFRYRVDLRKTGITAEEVRKELTPYWTTDYKRKLEYWSNLVVNLDPIGKQALKLPNLDDLNRNNQDRPIGTLRRYSSAEISARAARVRTLVEGINLWVREDPKLANRFGAAPAVDPLALSQASEEKAYRDIAKQRMDAALQVCGAGFTPDVDAYFVGTPIQLMDLSPEEMNLIGNPTRDTACGKLTALFHEGVNSYIDRNVGPVDLASVSGGKGLNYLITLVRKRAYQDMDVEEQERVEQMDGYGQIDTPGEGVQYHARPLAGIWATAPFLHNGSVPSLYEMLLPAYQRSKKFYLKGANFDPRAVGLYADGSEKGAFLFDTTVPGNSNAGHEFRRGFRQENTLGGMPMFGAIGPEMTDEDRWAIIEYLKIRRDIYDPVCPETNYVKDGKAVPEQAAQQQAAQPPAPTEVKKK
jgi:mono/diheme cytochrome c family protein